MAPFMRADHGRTREVSFHLRSVTVPKPAELCVLAICGARFQAQDDMRFAGQRIYRFHDLLLSLEVSG